MTYTDIHINTQTDTHTNYAYSHTHLHIQTHAGRRYAIEINITKYFGVCRLKVIYRENYFTEVRIADNYIVYDEA